LAIFAGWVSEWSSLVIGSSRSEGAGRRLVSGARADLSVSRGRLLLCRPVSSTCMRLGFLAAVHRFRDGLSRGAQEVEKVKVDVAAENNKMERLPAARLARIQLNARQALSRQGWQARLRSVRPNRHATSSRFYCVAPHF
jgi:hypothetical protein